ncbi:hypothetical protein D3C85_1432760 [compost metagenome]
MRFTTPDLEVIGTLVGDIEVRVLPIPYPIGAGRVVEQKDRRSARRYDESRLRFQSLPVGLAVRDRNLLDVRLT